MYIAKLNDRGKASYYYMFDEQLYQMDDLFSKSYYMKKDSDKQVIIEYCNAWNTKYKDKIRKNKTIYYTNVFFKGLLQAPALVVLYSGIVMGMMLLFGSEIFYEHVVESGVAAFGAEIRTYVIITYVAAAVIGLLASLSTYNNVFYKLIRSAFSIAVFVIISPVFFEKVFFSNSNTMLTYTIICIVGCFFVRIIIDRLLTGIIRKSTEKMIRGVHSAGTAVSTEITDPVDENISFDTGAAGMMQPVINRVKNNERLKQYKRYIK